MNIKTEHFDWAGELEKNVVHSLATSFGLDFLLFEDKRGGDVDTVHNARVYQKELIESNNGRAVVEEKVNISKELLLKLDSNGRNIEPYKKVQLNEDGGVKLDKNGKVNKKDDYHGNSELYRKRKKNDSEKREKGELIDPYRNKVIEKREDIYNVQNGTREPKHKNVELDHKVASSEIHDDLGRILSGLDGVKLANSDDNLVSVNGYVNNIKNDYDVDEFFNNVIPRKLESNLKDIDKLKEDLKSSDLSGYDIGRINEEISILEEKNTLLLETQENESSVREQISEARNKYNRKIDIAYYTSSKFMKSTALNSCLSGLKMGTRQALGLVIAEVWFEIKEIIPSLLLKYKYNFEFSLLLEDLKKSLFNIFERVKKRFSEILIVFRDAGLSGIMSSLTSTLINIVATTSKLAGKLIREMWSPLIQVAKLIFFNPENLSLGELTKNVLKILGGAAAVFLGSILHAELNSLLAFPFGSDIAAFISALVTGIITLLISYFLEHSELMQKVWGALDNFFKDKYDLQLEEFQRLNRELDNTLLEIAKIELSFDVDELKVFNDSLLASSCEYEKSKLIKLELDKKRIDMPYEFGNTNSMVDWLVGLRK